MILIADSGSTKCDWIGIKEIGDNTPTIRFSTQGLNPTILADEAISKILNGCKEINRFRDQVERIFFFGAGCGEKSYQKRMVSLFDQFFRMSDNIMVDSDLAAAVYACTTKPGVICILGTGSNCCFYNGVEIITKIPSLGYSIMDDGSGNYFGRMLLREYFFKNMPKDISNSFRAKYNLDPEDIKHKLYEEGRANAYLASFATFLFDHYTHEYIQSLIMKGIRSFLDTHLQLYAEELKNYPLHFVGSIAHYSKDNIKLLCQEYGYKFGNVIQKPMENLYKNLILL